MVSRTRGRAGVTSEGRMGEGGLAELVSVGVWALPEPAGTPWPCCGLDSSHRRTVSAAGKPVLPRL